MQEPGTAAAVSVAARPMDGIAIQIEPVMAPAIGGPGGRGGGKVSASTLPAGGCVVAGSGRRPVRLFFLLVLVGADLQRAAEKEEEHQRRGRGKTPPAPGDGALLKPAQSRGVSEGLFGLCSGPILPTPGHTQAHDSKFPSRSCGCE